MITQQYKNLSKKNLDKSKITHYHNHRDVPKDVPMTKQPMENKLNKESKTKKFTVGLYQDSMRKIDLWFVMDGEKIGWTPHWKIITQAENRDQALTIAQQEYINQNTKQKQTEAA